jgi:hypothetical protein
MVAKFQASDVQQKADVVKSNLTQGQKNPDLIKYGNFFLQITPAISDFFGKGLVLRWRTPHACTDVHIPNTQAIHNISAGRLVGKTRIIKGPVQPITRRISGKHPPCSVGTMGGRGQSHDQNFGIAVTKARHRFPPIMLIGISFCLHQSHVFTMCHQSGTSGAIYYLVV